MTAPQGISNAHRFSLTIPACVTTCATVRVEPEVTGISSPFGPHADPFDDGGRQDALALPDLDDIGAETTKIIR